MKTGEFRADLEPKAVAYMIFGSMEGLLLLAKNLKEVEPLEPGFRAVLDCIRAREDKR
jgi:hypothetical protein